MDKILLKKKKKKKKKKRKTFTKKFSYFLFPEKTLNKLLLIKATLFQHTSILNFSLYE